MASCDGLVGLSEPELIRRFGEPSVRREVGADTWLVFGSEEVTLRVRLAGSTPPRVASWTATFETGFRHLSEAARVVGLWPAAAPDQEATGVGAPPVRRPLLCPISGRVHSLTATVRRGLFTALTVFDESPDWL
jgi:hypothetical protein